MKSDCLCSREMCVFSQGLWLASQKFFISEKKKGAIYEYCVHFPAEKSLRLYWTFKGSLYAPLQKRQWWTIDMEAKSVFKVLLVTQYEENENDNNSNRISWRQNSTCQTQVPFLPSIQASDVILRKKGIKEAMAIKRTE